MDRIFILIDGWARCGKVTKFKKKNLNAVVRRGCQLIIKHGLQSWKEKPKL
jgi:hypothetical protein